LLDNQTAVKAFAKHYQFSSLSYTCKLLSSHIHYSNRS